MWAWDYAGVNSGVDHVHAVAGTDEAVFLGEVVLVVEVDG